MARTTRTRKPAEPAFESPSIDHLWTSDDVAAYARIGRGTVRNMKSRGELPPAIQIRRSVRWDPQVIIEWLQALTDTAAA
jgi:predicted DNA-binding transcriptional regulator AlpA